MNTRRTRMTRARVRRRLQARAAAERPQSDGNQRAADDAFAPRGNLFDRRQQIAQEHRDHRDDDDAGGMTETPRPSCQPAAFAIGNGNRRDRREVVGSG